MEDHIEYLYEMTAKLEKYKQLKQQLTLLEKYLLNAQEVFEAIHFISGGKSCVKDSIVELVRNEMTSAGL